MGIWQFEKSRKKISKKNKKNFFENFENIFYLISLQKNDGAALGRLSQSLSRSW